MISLACLRHYYDKVIYPQLDPYSLRAKSDNRKRDRKKLFQLTTRFPPVFFTDNRNEDWNVFLWFQIAVLITKRARNMTAGHCTGSSESFLWKKNQQCVFGLMGFPDLTISNMVVITWLWFYTLFPQTKTVFVSISFCYSVLALNRIFSDDGGEASAA